MITDRESRYRKIYSDQNKRATSSSSSSYMDAEYQQVGKKAGKQSSAKAAPQGSSRTSSHDIGYPDQDYQTNRTPKPKTTVSHRGKKKKRKKKGCLGFFVKLILFLSLVTAALFFLMTTIMAKMDSYPLDKSQIVINKNDKAMNKYQTIVLYGVDDQDNQIKNKGSRTDSIIVASINKGTKEVRLMSIYRDTYVSIDGNYDKINAAYSYGGPELAISTINRNLDLDIENFATVNFKALADAVDIVGGITLTIETEKELENLNNYIGNMNKINGGDSPKFDELGTYTFDGNQAVAYSRIRYMEGGDHARANHQRLVVQGLVKELKKKPWKLKALIDTVVPQCRTSFTSRELASLAFALPFYKIVDSAAYPFDSFDEKYNGVYYGFATSVYSNTQKAHEYLYGTIDYKPTEELSKISEKVKNISDSINY